MTNRRRVIFKKPSQRRTQTSVTWTVLPCVLFILCDPKTNEIALMHIVKANYYQLAGGGVEGDKDHKSAMLHEILEEAQDARPRFKATDISLLMSPT